MPRVTAPLIPATERLIIALGERLRLARLRRRLPAGQVAERAGMAEKTLRAIERGSPAATLGAYAAVLQVLQLENGLASVAADDPLGRTLQDKALEGRLAPRRAPRTGKGRTTAPEHRSLASAASKRAASPAVTSDALLALLEPAAPSPSKAATDRGRRERRGK